MSHVLAVGSPLSPSFADLKEIQASGGAVFVSRDVRLTLAVALAFLMVVGGSLWLGGKRPMPDELASLQGFLLMNDAPAAESAPAEQPNAPASLPAADDAPKVEEKAPVAPGVMKEDAKKKPKALPKKKAPASDVLDLAFPDIDLGATLAPKRAPTIEANNSEPTPAQTEIAEPSREQPATEIQPSPPPIVNVSPQPVVTPLPPATPAAAPETVQETQRQIVDTPLPAHDPPPPANAASSKLDPIQPIPAPPREPMAQDTFAPPAPRSAVVKSARQQDPLPPVNEAPTGDSDDEIVARSQPIERGSAAPRGNLPQDNGEPIASSVAPEATTNAPAQDLASADVEFQPLDRESPHYVPLGPRGKKSLEFDPVGQGQATWLTRDLARRDAAVMTTVQKREGSSETPSVVSYDVKMYRAIEGDTLQTVSETMYRTPEFATALAHYNRMSLAGGDPIAIGTRLRIPPPEVLSRFDARSGPSQGFQRVDRPVIGLGSQAVSGPSGVSPVSNTSLEANRAAGPGAPAFDETLVQRSASFEDGPNTYRVEQSETLWAISKKRLGDGRRWREIHSLNRDRLTSETNVPAGTVLRLPTQTPVP